MAAEAQNEGKNHEAALYRGAQIAMRGGNSPGEKWAQGISRGRVRLDFETMTGRYELTSLSLGADILTVLTRNPRGLGSKE